MEKTEIKRTIEEMLTEDSLTNDQTIALTQVKEILTEKLLRSYETEEEREKQKNFNKEGNKHLEKEAPFWISMWSIDLERLVVLLRIMLREIRFDVPFRLVIDYDPNLKKPRFMYYTEESKTDEGNL